MSQETPELEAKAVDPAAPATAEPAAETVPSLEEMLRQAELAAQEHHDAWLRARAECDNIRKRAESDVQNARKFALEGFATELLAVKDSLEAALASNTADAANLRNGVELTLKQLASVFGKFNVMEMNPTGEKFDPHKHQAMGMVEAQQEANTVVQVLQKGYQLHERVIRPALVMVAKGK